MSEIHAGTVLYVRDTIIPEQTPPITETGAIKWIRENLLSSWLNVLLTVVSLAFIWFALSHIVPWFWHMVWNTGSLNECREIRDATWEPGVASSCFSVIHDRWTQFLFGFYPADSYWRPVLALALFFVALAPVLFADYVPSRLLAFSAIYPFLATWLVWGGSFWGPLLVLLGFVAGYLGYVIVARYTGSLTATLAAIVAALLWWGVASPLIGDGLNRLVGGMRIESTKAEQTALAERLPEEVAALEEARDALDLRIADAVARKSEILDKIDADRAAGNELALDAQRVELAAQMKLLTALRKEKKSLEQHIGALLGEQSDARSLLASIEALPETEARLPEMKAVLAELEARLPDALAGLSATAEPPADTPAEELAQLRFYRNALDKVTAAEASIDETYSALALTGLKPVKSRNIGGFTLALIIGIAGIVLSLPLGILLALGRQSDLFIINKFSVVFIELIRGVPLIVWLFTASLLLNYFLPPGTNFDLMLRVIIMVTLFSSAYIAEVVRGGLAALPRGQYEAGEAVGLDYWKSMRLIILPQALKISIPGIVNTFIGLFKDTTLVVFIGLLDPIGLSNTVRADSDWNGIYWEIFVFIGAMFFIFCFSMGRYSIYLEKKLQTGHR